jgi:hypothetical protein
MPETTDYMVLGFAATIIILALTVGYFALKARNLQAELKILESIEQSGEVPADSKESRPSIASIK